MKRGKRGTKPPPLRREVFIDCFVGTFLATWCALNYDMACASGQHERLEKPPVEDARFLAEKAWEATQALGAG